MLVRPTAEACEKYLDFVYKIALDQTRSGYPVYTDGIKTKDDFVDYFRKGFRDANRSNFIYMENGTAQGWIQYTFLEEDAYLQTEIFNIAGNIRQALSEFVAYCEKHFHGYSLYLGFPSVNTEAVSFLEEAGWECIERDYNDVLFFDNYHIRPEENDIVRVNRENFRDFKKLHEPIQGEMYWNCDRLYADLENWEIYLQYEGKEPVGAIYYTDEQVLVEIFGVDFVGDRFEKTVFRSLLVKVLNDCKKSGKKYMVFFNDDQTQETVLDMGFTCVGQYVLYIRDV